MSNLVPFSDALPAHLRKSAALFAGTNTDLRTSMGPTYPVLSIKGKVWSLVENSVKTKLTEAGPDGDKVPVQSLKVMIVRANPSLSKIFYKEKFTEDGSEGAPPDCSSWDGKTPDAHVKNPQSKTCATCDHNIWGTGANGQGRACSDSRRLAIAPEGDLSKVTLLRVPAASLKALHKFAELLEQKGVVYQQVMTRIAFDSDAAHPQITFKPVGFLTEEEVTRVAALQEDPIVKAICGFPDAPGAQHYEQPEPPADKVDAGKATLVAAVAAAEAESKAAAAEAESKAAVKAKADAKAARVAKAKAAAEALVAAAAAEEDDDDDDTPEEVRAADTKPEVKATGAQLNPELEDMISGLKFDDM